MLISPGNIFPFIFPWNINFPLCWKKWWENILLFCPLHCLMDEETLWFFQGLSFNCWAIASEIGCCYCVPYKGYCIFGGLKSYCFFFSVAVSTPETLQFFLFSETWTRFGFAFFILVWFVQLSYIDWENGVLEACVNYLPYTEP